MATDLRRRFHCPVELTMELLGGKWRPVILARLKAGPRRYGDLRRVLPSLSEKMLTQTLRDLEEVGLVAPSRAGRTVTYALTARAEALKPALEALYAFGEAVAPELGARIEPARELRARRANPTTARRR